MEISALSRTPVGLMHPFEQRPRLLSSQPLRQPSAGLMQCLRRPIVLRAAAATYPHVVYEAVGSNSGNSSFLTTGTGAATFHVLESKGELSQSAGPNMGDSSFSAQGTGVATFRKQQRAEQPRNGSAGPNIGDSSFSEQGTGIATFRKKQPTEKLAQTGVTNEQVEKKETLQQKLKAVGLAGVAAYGLCNTLYYTAAFWYCWVNIVQAPQGLGVQVAARKCVEVLGLVWAGSQVTKVARAWGALLLAPGLDFSLSWFASRFKASKEQAFAYLVVGCLSLAAVLFGGVVVAWA